MENKRKEKPFQDVMDASLRGVRYEASAVAEHERGSGITIDVTLRWPLEAIEADYCVTPTVEFRLADYEAGPKTGLIKYRKARGLAPSRKAGGTRRWVPAKEETYWSSVHNSFP